MNDLRTLFVYYFLIDFFFIILIYEGKLGIVFTHVDRSFLQNLSWCKIILI